MVKHTQTIPWQIADKLSVFDHFVLRELIIKVVASYSVVIQFLLPAIPKMAFLKEITLDGPLGKTKYYIYKIKFQFPGSPHVHVSFE